MSGRSPPLYCTLILITMRSYQSYPNIITVVIHSYEYSTNNVDNVDNISTIETYMFDFVTFCRWWGEFKSPIPAREYDQYTTYCYNSAAAILGLPVFGPEGSNNLCCCAFYFFYCAMQIRPYAYGYRNRTVRDEGRSPEITVADGKEAREPKTYRDILISSHPLSSPRGGMHIFCGKRVRPGSNSKV